MPESDSSSSSPPGTPFEPRNLPVPVTPAEQGGDNWFLRAVRALFGWKPSTVRADLKDILDVMSPGESGFSPEESRMLKNILGLRERRVGDVMVPRADIVAVQQDINIGEQIVGEIADEHDDEETLTITQQPDGSYVADARATIEDVVGTVGNDFDVGDAADEVDTIGGYLSPPGGRLPVRGEIVPGPGLFEFEVLDADPRRVKRVRITRLKERRERPREPRRREADAAPGSTAPPA